MVQKPRKSMIGRFNHKQDHEERLKVFKYALQLQTVTRHLLDRIVSQISDFLTFDFSTVEGVREVRRCTAVVYRKIGQKDNRLFSALRRFDNWLPDPDAPTIAASASPGSPR